MTEPTSSTEGEAPPPRPVPPPRKPRWKLWFLLAASLPVIMLVLYTVIALNWSYSVGERYGALYKLSKKGWICKTWEGELNVTPGSATPTIWHFSVRSDSAVEAIKGAMGKMVTLEYEEHRGLPTSCFGETPYFVTAVRASP